MTPSKLMDPDSLIDLPVPVELDSNLLPDLAALSEIAVCAVAGFRSAVVYAASVPDVSEWFADVDLYDFDPDWDLFDFDEAADSQDTAEQLMPVTFARVEDFFAARPPVSTSISLASAQFLGDAGHDLT